MREINLNLNEAKTQLAKLKGKTMRFTINRGRNRFVSYTGQVENLYPFIFTIRVDDEDSPLQSYAYSDLLTKNVMISKNVSEHL